MKSPNMMSITGRIPVMAAPTAMPVKPASEIGVSSTRLAPNSTTNPVKTLNGCPASAMSSPRMNTRGSRRISSASASRMACASVSSRVAVASSVDILTHLVRAGIRRVEPEFHRACDLSLYLVIKFFECRAIGQALRLQPFAHDPNGVALCLPLLLFLLRTIIFAADIADMVSMVAIGVHQQQRGTIARPRPLHQLFRHTINRAHILAIHLFGRHAESRTARQNVARRGFREMRVLVVHVVFANVDHRQFPQRRHVHHF